MVLSSDAIEKIDDRLKDFYYLDETWNELYRNQSHYGVKPNHIFEKDNKEIKVYKPAEISTITNVKLRNILNMLSGNWNMNIDKTLEKYGDMYDSNIISCKNLNNKTQFLTSWLLSFDVNEDDVKNSGLNYHEDLKARCKKILCFDNHMNKFKYNNSVSKESINDKDTVYNIRYYKNRKKVDNLYLLKTGFDFDLGINIEDNEWVPGYFIESGCLGSGFKDELYLFENTTPDSNVLEIPLFQNSINPYFSNQYQQNSWYIDYSNSLISFEMITPTHGLIKFHYTNDINSPMVFYCDFYIVDADENPEPCLYAILHKSPNSLIYKLESARNLKTNKHESCICKIYLDKEGNLVFEDNIIFPNLVLSRGTPILGCNSVPIPQSLGALYVLFNKIAQKILNTEKKRLGIEFEVYDFGSQDSFPTNIENNIINTLENIHELIFNYLPSTTRDPSCENEKEEEEEEEESESELEELNDDSISGLINDFLYLYCDGATLNDPVDNNRYTIYLYVMKENNKFNLVRTTYNKVIQTEKELSEFCRNTGLGAVSPNSSVKNNGLLHSILLGESGFSIPKIEGQYSEDEFVFKCNDNICVNNKDDLSYLLYESPSSGSNTYCNYSNFENSEEILGKCNLENKKLLEEVCRSHATPLGNVGYPYKCSIADLNNLTEKCEDFDMPCRRADDSGCIKTYPASYPIDGGSNIELGGSCSNHSIISNEMELINNQTITNQNEIKKHTENRDYLLTYASTLNESHATISDNHNNNLSLLEEKSEDTTKMRVCNARKRKYDFKTKTCTDEFLEFSVEDPNTEYYKCEQHRLDTEGKGKLRLYVFTFVFLIIFFICGYIIFLR